MPTLRKSVPCFPKKSQAAQSGQPGVLPFDDGWDAAGPFSVIVRPYVEDGAQELCMAAKSGCKAEVVRILEMPVDPSSGDYERNSPLHFAAYYGCLSEPRNRPFTFWLR